MIEESSLLRLLKEQEPVEHKAGRAQPAPLQAVVEAAQLAKQASTGVSSEAVLKDLVGKAVRLSAEPMRLDREAAKVVASKAETQHFSFASGW